MNDHRLIWAKCQSVHDMYAIAALYAQLQEDGDPFTVLPTLADGPDGVVAPPAGRRQLQTFLGLYEPSLLIWVGGSVDTATLQSCANDGVRSIFVNCTTETFENLPRTWLPARRRALVNNVKSILALDDDAKQAAIRAGAAPAHVKTTGKLTQTASILPYDEDDRASFASALGARPVWFAAAITPMDTQIIMAAHGEASRRTHRLLLVISPRVEDDVEAINQQFVAQGYRTALRSKTLAPSEDTQVYIADTSDELGLWHRVAPISFLGGSFEEGARVDPFAAAALGSVPVHGPNGGNWNDQIRVLNEAGATARVVDPAHLGKTITSLLSADRTAMMAHAGWDVTTRGAMALETLVQIVRETLEQEAS